MAQEVEFYQIYWREEQKKQFYSFAIPYLNPSLTVFFENSCIVDIVPSSQAKKVAVVSWNLKRKHRIMNVPPYREVTEELLHSDYDILSFTKNTRHHQMLAALELWHNGSIEILRKICDAIGLICPHECKFPIYQNAFCADRSIYQEYISSILWPAMQVMEFDEEIKKLCWQDSNYYKLKEPSGEFFERVERFIGIYCPLHPFLLERLFSIWINDKKFNVQYI